MARLSSGWGELLAAVRRCERGEPLPERDRQATLELATTVGLATLPSAVGCSISLQRPDGGFATPAAAGPAARILDDVQYAQDDGPCQSAARTGRPQRVDDLATDPRWPELVRRAADAGVASLLSVPLPASRLPGALNLYGDSRQAFASAWAMAVAGVIARATSALLMDVEAPRIEGLDAARMRRAIAERTLITRAQGVLMGRDRVSDALAFHRLAIRSGEEARPLLDIARQILDEVAAEDVSA